MVKSLSSISDYKNCIGLIEEILSKQKWTRRFLEIIEVIQRIYSLDFFIDVINCERGRLKIINYYFILNTQAYANYF